MKALRQFADVAIRKSGMGGAVAGTVFRRTIDQDGAHANAVRAADVVVGFVTDVPCLGGVEFHGINA